MLFFISFSFFFFSINLTFWNHLFIFHLFCIHPILYPLEHSQITFILYNFIIYMNLISSCWMTPYSPFFSYSSSFLASFKTILFLKFFFYIYLLYYSLKHLIIIQLTAITRLFSAFLIYDYFSSFPFSLYFFNDSFWMTVIVITFLFTFEFFYSILFYWYWFSTVLFLPVRQGYCAITTFLFSSLVAVLLFLYKIQDMNWIFRSIHSWRLK